MNVMIKVYLVLSLLVILVFAFVVVNIFTIKISPTGVFFSGIGLTFILSGWYQLHLRNEIIEYQNKSAERMKISGLNIYLTIYIIIGCVFFLIGLARIADFLFKK